MMVLLLLRARLLMALLLLLPLLAAAAADLQSCDSAAVRLSSGHRLPALGLGVWQTPRGGATAAAVRWALAHGYRHIDTAKLYQNEDEVGEAVLGSAVPRSEVFVTSKLWVLDARCSAPSECEAWALEQVDASLARAGLEYFDLFLVHSPHQPFPGGRRAFWRGLEAAVAQGKLRSIGVSNWGIAHLRELLDSDETVVAPAVNQLELHPWLQQRQLVTFCKERGLVIEAYSPLARGQKLGGASPELSGIATRLGRSEAQVLIRWSLQHGFVTLPKSESESRIASNAGVFGWELGAEAMATLDALDEGLVTVWNPQDTEL